MARILRIILAVIGGFVLGSVVNMALISVSGFVIPPPPGADTSTIEGLRASLAMFEPRHFVFPFLAHALGTLVGAAAARWLTPGDARGPAWAVGALFLLGGTVNAFMLPGPLWFTVLDLLAYGPMAWLGMRATERLAPRAAMPA
jgi:hypothetical protein